MGKSKYVLKMTRMAKEDLEDIYKYLSHELYNVPAAEDLMVKIESLLVRLKDFPFSGSVVIDDLLKNKGYRKLLIDNYIAFYLVNEANEEVIIMRVLYGRQKYQDLV